MEDKNKIEEVLRSQTPSIQDNNEIYVPPIPELNWKIINPYEDSIRRMNKQEGETPKSIEDQRLIRYAVYNRVYRCYKNWGVAFSVLLIVMYWQ